MLNQIINQIAISNNDIINIFTALILLLTALILVWTYKTHKNQLFIQNFKMIVDDIGSQTTIECRELLYYSKSFIDKLEKREDIDLKRLTVYGIENNVELARTSTEEDIQLRALLEVIKYIASMYNRVGMLMEKDKKLKSELLDHHGFVIGKMWIITEDVITRLTNWKKGYGKFKDAYQYALNNNQQYLEEFRRKRLEEDTNNLA